MPSAKGPRVEAFYHSSKWSRARKAAIMASGGICQRCGVRRAKIVHHIIPLTEQNVDNPEISLSLDNMIALCHPCHNSVHAAYDTGGRPDIVVRADGSVVEAGEGRLDPNRVADGIARAAASRDPPRGASPSDGGGGTSGPGSRKNISGQFFFF